MADIVISNLSKSFGEKKVLDNFSYTFKQGETTCIMGKSGCGKTTLINILLGLLIADSGKVDTPSSVSAVFQEDRLCENFSSYKNIEIACKNHPTKEKIRENMKATGLEDNGIVPVKVSQLSGGMKRRVSIIRAIVADKEVIIMDEPFKGLDENTRHLTAQYIKENTKGKTLIVVTHDPDEVVLLGGNLLTMKSV